MVLLIEADELLGRNRNARLAPLTECGCAGNDQNVEGFLRAMSGANEIGTVVEEFA
jgi:hypothetical protein